MKARIKALGSYLPERILSNKDLESMVETSDEWIFSRTGMKERRVAAADEACSDMGFKAAEVALKKANLAIDEIDLILVATMTPDHLAPSTAALVQARLGASKAAAMDIQAACTGFLYGLSTAKAFIEAGIYKNVLLIASEKMTAFVDYTDRGTCVLFGDGACAAVISGEGKGLAIDSLQLGADGSLADLLIIPAGGSREPLSPTVLEEKRHLIKMEGREVFKHAVRRMAAAAKSSLESTGLGQDDISWLVPHQANERIIDAVGTAFALPSEKIFKTVHKYGNTSASSIAIALDELMSTHTLNNNDHLLLVAFGAGLTWGAGVLTQVDA